MSEETMPADVAASVKQGQRAMWSSGDYRDIARTAEEVGADDGTLGAEAEYLLVSATKAG